MAEAGALSLFPEEVGEPQNAEGSSDDETQSVDEDGEDILEALAPQAGALTAVSDNEDTDNESPNLDASQESEHEEENEAAEVVLQRVREFFTPTSNLGRPVQANTKAAVQNRQNAQKRAVVAEIKQRYHVHHHVPA